MVARQSGWWWGWGRGGVGKWGDGLALRANLGLILSAHNFGTKGRRPFM